MNPKAQTVVQMIILAEQLAESTAAFVATLKKQSDLTDEDLLTEAATVDEATREKAAAFLARIS